MGLAMILVGWTFLFSGSQELPWKGWTRSLIGIRDTRLIVAIYSEAGGDSDTSPKSQIAAHSHVRSAPAWVCTHPQLLL